jgi:3-oxoacyl-[acyl-carrier-protein] synthase II
MEPAVNRPPVITGIGLVTVLGQSVEETWNALLAGRSIVDHARVPGFSGPQRAIALAERAAGEALAQAKWSGTERSSSDTGIFVGTSKGAIESWMTENADERMGLLCGIAQMDGELSSRLKFGGGPRMTISSACSSGLHALIRAVMAIASGEIRRALVVGVEASVHPLFVSSFRRLGVLAPEGHGCRPFDCERRGFVISEAAAAICLESAEAAAGRAMVRVDRWAAGSDGTHLTGGDPAGKALTKLLQRVAGSDCDLVHAHATGTVVNDPVELAAIAAAGESRACLHSHCLNSHCLYSHKGALGHSLGAAGMVSAVLNCLSHLHGRVPGNIRSTRPLRMDGMRFSTEAIKADIHRSAAVAAGFGGPLAAVGFVSC